MSRRRLARRRTTTPVPPAHTIRSSAPAWRSTSIMRAMKATDMRQIGRTSLHVTRLGLGGVFLADDGDLGGLVDVSDVAFF